MKSPHDTPPCERCGAHTDFVLQIHPAGSVAGARIYECPACGHHTWEDWRRVPSGPRLPRPAAPQQPQQQQQQQRQPAQSRKSKPRPTKRA